MRPKERIERINDKIQIIWEAHPDMRYFQLNKYLERRYSTEHGNRGRKVLYKKETHKDLEVFQKEPIVDLFHLEDDTFERFLDNLVKEQNSTRVPKPSNKREHLHPHFFNEKELEDTGFFL